ncbi:hypothetical protein P872_20180 [Rhodonellum psychrophilum GCM71 = DSM 17998]|uniref:Uncharacterized protein n=2 Tax=Rhodonellum TaxID=336827 RepID=U5BX59_9BACT|nr:MULTISPECIES: hypothetical protein [Rhodonellum]ERM81206.1 hypothetical protein P872_20180 [Rhodonellum psychrophilum GCM71 = DSM 17998]SDZ52465.1 hypothetical protein SAMN05444412_12026 [Rhodonellum ikkaensis]
MMADSTKGFSKNEPLKGTMDFNYLKNKGLHYVQQLSGGIWTDYNAHDPGLTILEQLCFALTDLAYRSAYDVEELLTTSKDNPIDAKNNGFSSPRMVFSRHPVTSNDFRKLLIDGFWQIQNVWINPVMPYDREEGLCGLNNLEILPSLAFQKQLRKDPNLENDFLKSLRTFLNRHRNLGEYFGEITLLKSQPFKLEANINIHRDEDPDQILAAILFGLEKFLYHPVAFSSFEELKGEKMDMSDIFSGPRLNSGFIKDSALKDRKYELHLEHFQKIFTSVSGVEKCWEIKIDSQPERKFLKIKPGTYVNLNIDDSEDGVFRTIRIFSNGNPMRTDKNKVNNLLLELWSKNFRSYQLDHYQEDYFEKNLKGNFRNPGKYSSIQHQFPLIYGIGKEGISTRETDGRKAMVMQLRAYLVFFEQHMANHLAQLANLNNIFSISYQEKSTTYHSQRLTSVVGYEDLEIKTKSDSGYVDVNIGFDSNPYTSESESEFLDRKNRLFDHLLARFGEKIDDLPFLIALKLNLIPNETEFRKVLLKRKSSFLIALENINYYQNKGEFFDQEKNSFEWLSGIEQILLVKTGIQKKNSSLVSKMITKREGEIFTDTDYDYQNPKVKQQDFLEGFRLITESEKKWAINQKIEGGIPNIHFGPIGLKRLMKNAVDFRKYMLSKIKSKTDSVEVIFQKEPNTWVGLLKAPNESEAIRKISETIHYFRQSNLDAEGFYLIDHILLKDFLDKCLLGFYVVDHEGKKTFQSEWAKTEEERRTLLAEFYHFGKERAFYFREEKSVVLKNSLRQVLAIYTLEEGETFNEQEFESLVQSNRELSMLMVGTDEEKGNLGLSEVEMIRLKGTIQGKNFRQRRVVLNRKQSTGTVFSEDFFDQKISICLPDWPARFQDNNFRDYFESLVRERIPAHLRVELYWLGFQEMEVFEAAYSDWLELKKVGSKANEEEFVKSSLAIHNLIVGWKGGARK